MKKQEAVKELAKLVNEAEIALKKATKFADQHSLEFNWYPARGMGGDYISKGAYRGSTPYPFGEKEYDDGYGWNPSSIGC